MIRYYLGEEAILANVETYLCRRPLDLEYTLDNLANLVVKRVGESGGYGMIIGPPRHAEGTRRLRRTDPRQPRRLHIAACALPFQVSVPHRRQL